METPEGVYIYIYIYTYIYKYICKGSLGFRVQGSGFIWLRVLRAKVAKRSQAPILDMIRQWLGEAGSRV